MKKEDIIGNLINGLIILIIATIMFLGGTNFLIISTIFLGSGALFEFAIMNHFYENKRKLIKNIPTKLKIANGFLWVHGIIHFIKINNTTIYNFKKLGYLPSFIAYSIMLIYVLVACRLFQMFSYWGLIVYLLPIITNTIIFFNYNYYITNKIKN